MKQKLNYLMMTKIEEKYQKSGYTKEKTRDFFTELYIKYIDLQRESETIEIIIANGYIKDNENSDIYHPILTKRLSMNFDALENTIYIMNTNAKSELYTELFQVMEDINLNSLSL